jgi:hypothetical protein
VLDGETVTVTVETLPFLWAPVRQGEAVGTVRYSAGDTLLYETSLCTQNAVEPAPSQGFFSKWLKFLKRLLTE